MLRREEMTCSKKQQQEPIWKKKQQDARTLTTKKPTLKTRREEKTKPGKTGFGTFPRRALTTPEKKANGYRAIHHTTKKLADAATRRANRNRTAKETTLRNTLRDRQL